MIDTRGRCPWAGADRPVADPLMVAYHDDEWGVPVHDDVELFERLALESFQAGLSWSTILAKREAFRAAFSRFDPVVVAAFDDDDRARLLADARIVRNRAKIDATIGNAAAFLATVAEHGSFDRYLAGIVPLPPTRLPATATVADIAASTPASDALSADLRRRGFRFVGSTIAYALMQSIGLVDDHLPGCFRYQGSLSPHRGSGGADTRQRSRRSNHQAASPRTSPIQTTDQMTNASGGGAEA